MKLLIKIAYKGTAYGGYQVQNNAPTVQGELTRAAEELFGSPCDIVGCSRTDSGVHANGFCASVSFKGTTELKTAIPTEKIPLAFCAHLPEDISVLSARWVDGDFHPRYDVKYKEYVYRVWNRAERNPFIPDMCYHYPKKIDNDALERMNEAAKKFCGEHDFKAFMAKGGNENDTVRNVVYASVCRDENGFIEFKVAANGFLYNMVRIMMGTLIAVAEGKISPTEIDEIIASGKREKAGMTAPPCGLFLNKVVY